MPKAPAPTLADLSAPDPVARVAVEANVSPYAGTPGRGPEGRTCRRCGCLQIGRIGRAEKKAPLLPLGSGSHGANVRWRPAESLDRHQGLRALPAYFWTGITNKLKRPCREEVEMNKDADAGLAFEPLVSRCRLEVRNAILGDSVFWEGVESDLGKIRSIPGRDVAAAVFRTGNPQKLGMWHGFPCG